MAKKKKKQKNSDDQNAVAVPKQIAGVKVPKPLRRAGAQAMELAKDPIVADLLAAGLIAAAGTLTRTKAGRKATAQAADTAEAAVKEAGAAGGEVKDTLIGIARDVLDAVEAASKGKKA